VVGVSKLKTIKTGVSLPSDVVELIDKYMGDLGVKSRSKLLAEAVRTFIFDRMWMRKVKGEVLGAFIVLYDEKRGETVKRLIDLQHEFLDEIIATLHFHASHSKCLEVILVKGESKDIIKLISSVENIAGVELARFFPVHVKEE